MGVVRGKEVIYEEDWYCENLKKRKMQANGLTEHDWIIFWTLWLVEK